MIHRSPNSSVHIDGAIIVDKNLSAEARLLLVIMLSQTDDHRFTAEFLTKESGLSEYKTKQALKELRKFNYLEYKNKVEFGRFDGVEWIIHENPNCTAKDEPEYVAEQPVIISAEEFRYKQLFEQFWSIYPKQVDREGAYKAFCKIPNIEEVFPNIMRALDIQIKSKQWREEGGRYIPKPENYLKKAGWNDVVIPDMEATKASMEAMMRILNYGTNN